MDLAAFLHAHGIAPERHEHPPVMTVEESERLVPKLPGAKTKNLFLRDGKGRRHFLVTVAHDRAVDINALGAALDAGRLGFASPERLATHLGITPGSVSLLALVNDTKHAVEFVIDRGLWHAERRARASAGEQRDDGRHARRSRALSRRNRAFAARDRRAGARGAVTSAPIVRVVDVHKSFGAVDVLRGISFDVGKGEAVCIIGPSGSGKSTLLRCINGLVPIDRGEIHVGAHAVHELATDAQTIALRKDVSIVFQQYNLFPHKTALENIMMAPVQVLKQPAAEVEQRAHELLKKVRLSGKESSYPGELSGGQQQRVAIARALAMRPQVMLFDEVTAALDPETRKEVLVTIRQLVDEGMTSILVTHEMAFAREIAQHVYFTDHGLIVEDGPPAQLFGAPQKERTRAFLEQVL